MGAVVPMDCHLLWKALRVMNLPTAVSQSLCSPRNSSWDGEWQLQERHGKSHGSTPAVSTAVWRIPASPATIPSHAGPSPRCLEFLHWVSYDMHDAGFAAGHQPLVRKKGRQSTTTKSAGKWIYEEVLRKNLQRPWNLAVDLFQMFPQSHRKYASCFQTNHCNCDLAIAWVLIYQRAYLTNLSEWWHGFFSRKPFEKS